MTFLLISICYFISTYLVYKFIVNRYLNNKITLEKTNAFYNWFIQLGFINFLVGFIAYAGGNGMDIPFLSTFLITWIIWILFLSNAGDEI